MDLILNEFQNLKISALNKAKLVNKDIHEVTIGPNSVKSESKHVVNHRKSLKPKKNIQFSNNRNFKDDQVSYGKILAEAEAQRRDEVQSSIQSRLANLNEMSRQIDLNTKSQWLKRQQYLIEKTKHQENVMLKILEEHDKKACDLSEKLQLEYQRQQDERQRRNIELQNLEKQKKEYKTLLENIHAQQVAFRSVYQEIVGILKGSNNKFVQPIISNNISIKSLPELMDKIKEKCKVQRVTNDELNMAMSLVQEIKKLKEKIAQEVVKLNEEYLRAESEKLKIQVENERVKAENECLKAEQIKQNALQQNLQQNVQQNIQQNVQQNITHNIEKPLTESSTAKSLTEVTFVSKENLRMYAELQQFLDNYENSFKSIVEDPNLKKFKFACQKAVNIPLNAISAVSSHHLQDKYQRLANLLLGKSVEAGGTVVCAAQHPQGIAFCTNLLAKKFVLQGDLIVSSKPEAAYCFAAVLTALWVDFPDFGKLLLAHFHKEMPYLVPMYPIMLQGQSDQDYYKSLGYHYNDGVIEKHDKFLKRMTGIMRLYSAVMITKLKRAQQNNTHPHGLSNGWRWFAAMLNLEPRVDITATVLFEFLEVVGQSMLNAYGKQFKKLLNFLTNEYLPLLQKIDSGGPMTRLEVLLQKIKTSGQIESPKGRLSEGFW